MRSGTLPVAALAATLLASAQGAAAPPAKPPSKAPAKPAPPAVPARPPASPLPMLPSVARVQVRVGKGQLVVVEDVVLPRGEWSKGSLDLYVAFGAPGVPRAVDARLVPLGDGVLAPEDDDAGEAVVVDRAPRRPPSANALLGRDTMAGVVVHLEAAALTRAFAPGGMAALRVRTVVEPPEEDATGGHGVLVRLGASRGTPLTLGRVGIVSGPEGPKLARAEAKLCGPEADDHPLAIATTPKVPPTDDAAPRIAPVLAVRRATDDLCIRYWIAP